MPTNICYKPKNIKVFCRELRKEVVVCFPGGQGRASMPYLTKPSHFRHRLQLICYYCYKTVLLDVLIYVILSPHLFGLLSLDAGLTITVVGPVGSTPGWVTMRWLLPRWVTVCEQVNHLGI